MLGVSSGGSGVLKGGGTYVTYTTIGGAQENVGGDGRMTIVFETMAANATQSLAVSVGLASSACASLVMWSTNATVQFTGPDKVEASSASGGCVIDLELPAASIVTITTSQDGSKLGGVALTIPASESFLSKNYSTNFDERSPGRPAYYWSDEGGSFALATDGANASNQVLRQMAPVHPVTGMGGPGPHWTGDNSLPTTLIGDVGADRGAVNILTRVRARMPASSIAARSAISHAYAFAALCGRIASSEHPYDPDKGGDPPGDCLNLTSAGAWKLTQGAAVGGFGNVSLSGTIVGAGWDAVGWHSLELRLLSSHTIGLVDGVQLFNVSSDGATGYVGLSSSYNAVDFDDFTHSVVPGPPPPPSVKGTAAVFERCASGSDPMSAHQSWALHPLAGDLSTGTAGALYMIQPSGNKKLCLDWSGPTALKVEACKAGDTKQIWNASATELKSRGGFIRAAGMEGCASGAGGTPVGGCCMEVAGNEPAAGTAADIYACEQSQAGAPCANEIFKIVETGGGTTYMRIVAGSTGFCLTE